MKSASKMTKCSIFFVATLIVQTANVGAFLVQPSAGRHCFSSKSVGFGSNLDQHMQRPIRSKRIAHLFMSSSTSSTNQVLYQKIIRPPLNGPPTFFLGQLVEYLQDRFEIPSNLPMIYKSVPVSSSSKAIVAWDSPLSSSRDETQLEVEVVGIFRDEDETFPSMAMVVVSKISTKNGASAPMMQTLFADSEKKILKSLDRGLDDFEAGRIKFSPSMDNSSAQTKRITSLEDAIEAELMEESPQSRVARNTDLIIDTTSTDEEIQKPIKSTLPTIPLQDGSVSVGNEDYAVEAARKAAKQRDKQQKGPQLEGQSGDFAVEAAKKIASKRKDSPVPSNFAVVDQASKVKGESKSKVKNQIMEPILASQAGPRRFSQVISTPDGYSSKGSKGEKITKKNPTTLEKSNPSAGAIASSSKRPRDSEKPSGITGIVAEKTRQLNLKVMDNDSIGAQGPPLDDDSKPTSSKTELKTAKKQVSTNQRPSQAELELEISKAAEKIMSEIVGEGEEMTAEEMLRKVMQFGDEQKREEAVGTGFATGAFEKAKAIFQDQKRKREERLSFKEPLNTNDIGLSLEMPYPGDISAEDELKNIFKAGERLAESRIQLKTDPEIGLSKKENELIDSLIASEKTVSSYARSLDDELTELEVRMNKSPGEEFDGPRKNPLFDVMSGPEVYNLNVDPETAVNWPGAQPGTKHVKLPKELNEALKQAKFAAEVMLNMREEESDGSTVGKEIKYFVGDRELTKAQVDNLRMVVAEGVNIGIIDDPLEYLAERSRLQMILDELWNQPDERFKEVAENYKDLLLSDNFVALVKERLTKMADRDLEARAKGTSSSLEADHTRERDILGQLVIFTQLLLKEVRALGAELEAQQIEVIRSICKVAMDPSHVTEEETAMALSDVVRDLRPLFDDVFVAYLKYAVAEEQGRLARAGLLDDPDHNQWLFVLQIVQQGVYNEISKGISRYIDHIWYVLRMNTRTERRMLLEKLIDVLPTMDVRPFVQVVDNIVSSLGDAVRGDFDPAGIGEMANKLIQLRVDVKELLPPERVNEMARDADEWAARQKEKMLEARNQTQKRLKAGRDIENDPGLESEIRRRGESERFD